MYFHKYSHPMNFVQPKSRELSFSWESIGSDVYRYKVCGQRWKNYESVLEFNTKDFTGKNSFSSSSENGSIKLESPSGGKLETIAEMPFGVSGTKWVIRFSLQSTDRFYGMGEKNNGFEKSGKRTKFWNTDVWADFAPEQINTGITDPMYVSIPYLLLHRKNAWFGMLLNNNFPVFMNTGAAQVIEGIQETDVYEKEFFIGSVDGAPDMFVIAGESAKEVTEKLFRLTGTAPRPPLWALGYHQSRWGYSSTKELLDINENLNRHGIPCDGIWMDIDYMDGYRVFTIDKENFSDIEDGLKTIRKDGRRVVPILDPGVKADKEYSVCREGLEKELFCMTEESVPYVGFVWPGTTYFPDFTQKETRQWWAEKTSELTKKGFGAYWVDMNDPSTGSAEVSDMRFNKGKDPHQAYHNQYALLMQMATWQGLSEALSGEEGERPFLLSRSASTGSNRYGAIWTGDNISNWHHLQKAVEMGLNLSLSGMAFFGSDIGGFGGDAEDGNFAAWFKALFLFPFFRNHCAKTQKQQEPWEMGPKALQISRKFIQARYALLPFIYNLFIKQEECGSPIITPLLYHFDGYSKVDDQFMVGNSIMQAPIMQPTDTRSVLIPQGRWFNVFSEEWIEGPTEIEVKTAPEETPVFIREGAIIPIKRKGSPNGGLENVDFLIFGSADKAEYTYRFDSGNGYGYKQGKDGKTSVSASFVDNRVSVEVKTLNKGFKDLNARILLIGCDTELAELNGNPAKLDCEEINFAGAVLNAKVLY